MPLIDLPFYKCYNKVTLKYLLCTYPETHSKYRICAII